VQFGRRVHHAAPLMFALPQMRAVFFINNAPLENFNTNIASPNPKIFNAPAPASASEEHQARSRGHREMRPRHGAATLPPLAQHQTCKRITRRTVTPRTTKHARKW